MTEFKLPKDAVEYSLSYIQSLYSQGKQKEFEDSVKTYKKLLINVDEGFNQPIHLAAKKKLKDILRSTPTYFRILSVDFEEKNRLADSPLFKDFGNSYTILEYMSKDLLNSENILPNIKEFIKKCNRRGIKYLIINNLTNQSDRQNYNNIYSDLIKDNVRFEVKSTI